MSNSGVVSRTIAELVFKEEDFAKCATKQDLSIEGFTRSCKGGESIVVGGCSVNMDNMLEKDGNVGSSKCKARNGEPLERCNVDFGPNKEMGSAVRLGMVDMLDSVTSQHVLYYCTYYSVSLTCTVHCTYCIYCTLYILYMFPYFPVSHVCKMLKLHLQHLFTHVCSLLFTLY